MADDRLTARGRGHRGARSGRPRDHASGADAVTVASALKERVYAAFTGLAIVLVTATSEHPEPDHAFLGLVLGVLGISIAGFAADVISHLAVHRSFPNRTEFGVMIAIAGSAVSTVFVPGIILALAWAGVFDLGGALRATMTVYIVTLAVIGWLAVRRSKLAWWVQLIALAMLLGLGLLVILLQTLAHSI
ncbi:hypothetical protein [Microbacterium sp. P04]|uniref:hypothetical protein n=1 Tax=Microbacterium sp. P04 TaxID=3366947 RepID=UPI003747227D